MNLLVMFRPDRFTDYNSAYGSDVSESGMFLHTEDALAVGSVLQVQFVLPEGTELVEVLAVVRRLGNKYGEPGVGVEFEQVNDAFRRAYAAICELASGKSAVGS